jgi:hypothetical protein
MDGVKPDREADPKNPFYSSYRLTVNSHKKSKEYRNITDQK